MKRILSKLVQPTTFILIGTITRVIPHPANFAPIAAMALFGGVYMGKKQAFVLPILAMILSDLLIGFDSLPMRGVIYGTFLATVLVGLWLKEHKNTKNVILASLFSSILFFVVTNFAVWAFGGMYAKNLLGLSESYVMAIPFFRNTILGDLFYSGVFFGGYEFVKNLIKRSKFALES
jgi:hypothetical protein